LIADINSIAMMMSDATSDGLVKQQSKMARAALKTISLM
jgi:hypothetical protein